MNTHNSLRNAIVIGLLALIAVGGVSRASAAASHASVYAWSARQQATTTSLTGYVHPAVATYKNRAYILHVDNGIKAAKVELTTNESGSWKTQVLSSQNLVNEFVALAVDSSNGTLYAVWTYKKDADTNAMGLWTRSPGGQWSSVPQDLDVEPAFYGPASVVAANGKAYVAFASEYAGACEDRRTDVQVVTYDGTSWSTPQNLTSCVPGDSSMSFERPRLAMDESGRLYLTTLENANNLWYMDNAGGSWSAPAQITQDADIRTGYVSFAQNGTYSIAASMGTAYVAYARHAANYRGSDIFMIAHPAGSGWSAPQQVSPNDGAGCGKWGVSLAAQSGRIGVSYIQGSAGNCQAAGNPDPSHDSPHLLTGTATGALTAVDLGRDQECNDTALTTDGQLFRMVTDCYPTPATEQLFYRAEALTTAAPAARIDVPRTVTGSDIPLRWGTKDSRQAARVSYYEVQVRDGTQHAYTTVYKKTKKTSSTYHHARKGHEYVFRVRTHDSASRKGTWAQTTVSVK